MANASASRQLEDGGAEPSQRVALLRAILRRQPLLLLDEPMTGLDTETRKILYAMLLEEKARGITMLLASHDEEERRILADSHWNL